MSKTFLSAKFVEQLLNRKLWALCSASILDKTTYSDQQSQLINKIEQYSKLTDGLVQSIEYHGLSGLIYSLIQQYRLQIPREDLMLIKANTAKHGLRWQAIHTLLHSISTNQAKNIRFCLLKGSALAADIYQNPSHRAMADIDIMCSSEDANRLYQQLLASGFSEYKSEKDRLKKHHHLPVLSKNIGQHCIYLEIHTFALSFDLNSQISWQDIEQNLRTISIENHNYLTLSHEHMLLHLCCHTFSRDQVIKLSNIVDIFRYAIVHEHDIDWQFLEKQYPEIILKMRYARLLLNIPYSILPFVKPVKNNCRGKGKGMMPLREYNNTSINLVDRIQMLFFPSEWWQKAFYDALPEDELSFWQKVFCKKSFWYIRYITHPLKVISWSFKKFIF